MKLFDAFELSKSDIIALVGGGGKTTTMFTLGREATERHLKTVLTTTTRIYCPADPEKGLVMTRNSQELFSALSSKLTSFSSIIAGAELAPDNNKLTGLDPQLIPGILNAGADLVIVEADGAARKPFKAPAAHEPVIPTSSTVVIPVVGVDCLNRPLLPEFVHRPEIVAELSGISLGDMVTPQVVAKVLTHPLGLRKGLPPNCRWIPLINKVESSRNLELARQTAHLIGQMLPCKVIIGASAGTTPVVDVLDFRQA